MTDSIKKIESLTAEQKALLPVHRAKYLKIGWSTEPADRPRAEKGMKALYRRMNLAEPEFVWLPSPLAAVELIKKETGQTVSLTGTDGQLDSYWLAFYTFADLIGAQIKDDDRAQLYEWADVIESCGPCYPYENVCIMTERPKTATFDDAELLHGDEAPALEYRDGFKIFAQNGIRMQERHIMQPWTLTLEEINGESNADVQTILQRLYCFEQRDSAGDRVGSGGGRYLEESGAKVIDRDDILTDVADGKEVRVLRALLEDKNGMKWIMSGDGSTDRIYFIQVDRNAKTCAEAQLGLEGIPESQMVGRA